MPAEGADDRLGTLLLRKGHRGLQGGTGAIKVTLAVVGPGQQRVGVDSIAKREVGVKRLRQRGFGFRPPGRFQVGRAQLHQRRANVVPAQADGSLEAADRGGQ